MLRMTVLYPRGEDSHFDMDYYLESHIPLMEELLGDAMARYEVDKGVGSARPGDPPPYMAVGHFFFASGDDMKVLGQHAREIAKDVPNFTNVQAEVQISKVVV